MALAEPKTLSETAAYIYVRLAQSVPCPDVASWASGMMTVT